MKFIALLALTAGLFLFPACERSQPRSVAGIARQESEAKSAQPQEVPAARTATTDVVLKENMETDAVSLDQANSANTASQAFDRKIIRNANLTVEVTSPGEAQHKLVAIAESHQGFIVTSESTQRAVEDKTKPEMTVNVILRVPAHEFDGVMAQVRAVGARIIQEKVTGQDVTEEFMDLDARIKNQKALELQFLEIMKRAGKVEDALNVQRELAEVRTEIEKLEGRRRFLENQSSLSTINVTLQPPTQIVNATGFWYSVRTAFSDGVEVATEIILFVIRAVIALAPIFVLIVLPLALLVKFGLRAVRRRRATLQPADGVSE